MATRVRTDRDTIWSDIAQGFKCLHCGQPTIKLAGVWHCQNDPDCLAWMQEDADEDAWEQPDATGDCAVEGYAVFRTDT